MQASFTRPSRALASFICAAIRSTHACRSTFRISSTSVPIPTTSGISRTTTANMSGSRITGAKSCPHRRTSRCPTRISSPIRSAGPAACSNSSTCLGIPVPGLPPRRAHRHHGEQVAGAPQINAASVGRWRNYEQYIEPLESLLREQPLPMGIDGTAMNEQANAGPPFATRPSKGSR